jgi:protein involved in polysaccharide export with SLBB domain
LSLIPNLALKEDAQMKRLGVFAIIAGLTFISSASAQVKPGGTANNHPAPPKATLASNATRARVFETSETTEDTKPETETSSALGNAALVTERPRIAVRNASVLPQGNPTRTGAPVANAGTPTQIYRVGVGDILDIQIPDSLSTKSTLYTVTEGGLIDYPLAGRPLRVAGLTTDVIAAQLKATIRVLKNPPITVKVRDYASHTVNVIGFVKMPGTKVLRREAVPLYVVLAEAFPLPEAVSVVVAREGKEKFVVDLSDTDGLDQLVTPGDVLKVLGSATSEYFFAGGEVNAPGQKLFHNGLTLTQAILASGGTSRNASNRVRVSRQSADGRLVSFEYNLQNIRAGKSPDPILQKGDRIEVTRD